MQIYQLLLYFIEKLTNFNKAKFFSYTQFKYFCEKTIL